MRTGRMLWPTITISTIIIFGFLKLTFYPDILYPRFGPDDQRAAHVLNSFVFSPEKKISIEGL